MVPKCIAERDEVAVKTIIISHDVRQTVRDDAQYHHYDAPQVPLAEQLLGMLPDLEAEHKEILQALHTLSDEDLMWLEDVVGPGYMRFRIVGEIIDHRPHLK